MKRNIIFAGLFIIILAMLFGCEKCETCTTTAKTTRNGVLVNGSETTTTFEVCDEKDINDYRDKTTRSEWKDGIFTYATESYTKCK